MSQRIGLYHGSARQGEIDFDTIFVMVPADYTCEPKGVVTHDEVREIAKVLRRGRDIETGVVGKFDWCREYPPRTCHSCRANPTW